MSPTTMLLQTNPANGAKLRLEVPILIRWEKLQKLLSGKDKRIDAYRRELFGSDIIETSPDEYQHYGILEKLNLLHMGGTFEELPIRERAKIYAYLYLKNIVDILDRHTQLQEKNIKGLAKDS